MPKKKPEDFQYLSNDPNVIADPEISEFMEEEIARAPQDAGMLADTMSELTHVSPAETGGDMDADFTDADAVGTETPGGDNALPDANMTEENAEAIGVTYQDNEPLEFIDKIDRRDRNRFELDPMSKTEDNSI